MRRTPPPLNMQIMRTLPYALFVVWSIAASAHAQSIHPPSVTAEGAAPIPKAAEAARSGLLGVIDLYRLAVYVGSPVADRAQLLSSNVPKALRIVITYEDDLFRPRFPIDWRRELIPVLEPAAVAHLQGTFAPLQHGDVVLVEYVPAKGTTVRVNKAVAVTGGSHELMLAFLDHWLGQRPVSEEVKRALMGAS